MPELPEVETVKRSLAPKLIGQSILSCKLSSVIHQSHANGKKALLKKQPPTVFQSFFQQVRIINLERRSKYLLLWLEKEKHRYCLISHLGMTGAWFVVADTKEIEAKYQKHIHATFALSNGQTLVYSDIRRFGELQALTEAEFETFTPIQSLGPEPFDKEAFSDFLENVRSDKNHHKTVKSLIMNQRVLAGVGNIYACESLFLSQLHPEAKATDITDEEWRTLFQHIHDLLLYSISVGGASISDYVDADGKRGSFQKTLRVYQQKDCSVCGHAIQRVDVEKRTSFFCPICQPLR